MRTVRELEFLPGAARQRGVALAMVVWFLAAMSLLVMGIVHHARVDVQMTQVHIARAKVAAAGDGAINLMLARHMNSLGGQQRRDARPVFAGAFRLGPEQVAVKMTAVEGLLDLHAMPREALTALLVGVGGLPPAQAGEVAANMIELRGFRRQGAAAESIEGFLLAPGFDRALLDRLRDVVRAVPGGGGWMDWRQAPPQVVEVLRSALPGQGRQDRNGGDREQTVSRDGAYRVDATVAYNGRTWLRRRWVEVSRGGRGELPWRVLRSEPPRVIGEAQTTG